MNNTKLPLKGCAAELWANIPYILFEIWTKSIELFFGPKMVSWDQIALRNTIYKNRLSSKNVLICIDIFQRITFLGYFQVIVSSLYQFIYFACILRKLKILSLEGKPMERVYLTDTDSLLLVFDRSPFSDSSSCDCSSQTFTIERFKRSIEAHASLYATNIGLKSGLFCEFIICHYLKETFW